jgi:hypothetical protein
MNESTKKQLLIGGGVSALALAAYTLFKSKDTAASPSAPHTSAHHAAHAAQHPARLMHPRFDFDRDTVSAHPHRHRHDFDRGRDRQHGRGYYGPHARGRRG